MGTFQGDFIIMTHFTDLIMELGPVVEDKYDYSLVTNPTKTSLFVLARDLARFEVKTCFCLCTLNQQKLSLIKNKL